MNNQSSWIRTTLSIQNHVNYLVFAVGTVPVCTPHLRKLLGILGQQTQSHLKRLPRINSAHPIIWQQTKNQSIGFDCEKICEQFRTFSGNVTVYSLKMLIQKSDMVTRLVTSSRVDWCPIVCIQIYIIAIYLMQRMHYSLWPQRLANTT